MSEQGKSMFGKIGDALRGGQSQETKFVPPWEKYKKVASAVKKGNIEGALSRPELKWLDRDLDSMVRSALTDSSSFDSGQIRFMDALSGVKPDDSSLEARIYQRWAEFPQIKAMKESTGLKRDVFMEIIKGKLQHYQEHPEDLQPESQEK